MGVLEDVLSLAGEHCDLEQRVKSVPPSAMVRGVLFRNIDSRLAGAGKQAQYRELIGGRQFSALRFYPATEYLQCLVAGGAVLASPEDVHRGMEEIGRRNATAVSESLLGRTLLRLLSPNPERLLQQGVAARRQTCRYGKWELDLPEPGCAEMRFTNEYVWIESNLIGAARGAFECVGIDADIQYELDGPFSGVHRLSWS